MSTVYLTGTRDKLAGAIATAVSSATDAVTQRGDSKASVEALGHTIQVTASFTETTAVAAREGYVHPIPFNGKVTHVYFATETGTAGGAGYTNYASVILYAWDADGDGTTAVGTWNGTTDTVTVKAAKAVPLTASAVNVVAGGSLQFQITKTGTGATTGVMTCIALVQREDD